MPLPPKCPTQDCDDWLWKDTTTTDTDWDNWRWWCRRCDRRWYPTAQQLGEFRQASSRPPGGRHQSRPGYPDPRVTRR